MSFDLGLDSHPPWVGDQAFDGVRFAGVAALGADGNAGLFGTSESSVLGEGTNVRPLWWKERLTALESGL